MPPTAFRQDHFLGCEITKVLVDSAVHAAPLQAAENEDISSKAVARKNAVAESEEEIESHIKGLLKLVIQSDRHQRTEDGRKVLSTLHKKLAGLFGHLSTVSAVDKLAPELKDCKEELEAIKSQHESCKEELQRTVHSAELERNQSRLGLQQLEAELQVARQQRWEAEAREAATYGRLLRMNDRITVVEEEETRLNHVLSIENKSKQRYRQRLLQEKEFSSLLQWKQNNWEKVKGLGCTGSKRKATDPAPGDDERRSRQPNE